MEHRHSGRTERPEGESLSQLVQSQLTTTEHAAESAETLQERTGNSCRSATRRRKRRGRIGLPWTNRWRSSLTSSVAFLINVQSSSDGSTNLPSWCDKKTRHALQTQHPNAFLSSASRPIDLRATLGFEPSNVCSARSTVAATSGRIIKYASTTLSSGLVLGSFTEKSGLSTRR